MIWPRRAKNPYPTNHSWNFWACALQINYIFCEVNVNFWKHILIIVWWIKKKMVFTSCNWLKKFTKKKKKKTKQGKISLFLISINKFIIKFNYSFSWRITHSAEEVSWIIFYSLSFHYTVNIFFSILKRIKIKMEVVASR